MSIKKIAARLGVAASSVSMWVRDIPGPPRPQKKPKHHGRPRTVPVEIPGGPTRLCGSCDRVLPLTAFNRAGDGHQHWCRDCFSAYFRERGAKHREQSAVARRRRQQAAREVVRAQLAEHPCVDCGEDDILVLEFDHVSADKTTEVARMIGAGARAERVRREMEKCDVVCVNCHRRRTATRAGRFRVTGKPAATWTASQHRNAAFLVELLRRSGCCDCGESDPVVLDFDHIGEKRATVTKLATGASIATLRAEIERCVIRCANCHRLRTLNEAGAWRSENHWGAEVHSNPEGPAEI